MNFEKLFKTIEGLITLRDIASDRGEAPPPSERSGTEAAKPGFGAQLETRLTNVLVAALKEAFDRDHTRLELERVQIEEQRRRAEEAMRLELTRQATDREMGRLRLLSAAALIGWIVSVALLVIRSSHAGSVAMALLIAGCLLLLGSLGAAFTAQQRVTSSVAAIDPPNSGAAGSAALWLLLSGLALSAASLLL